VVRKKEDAYHLCVPKASNAAPTMTRLALVTRLVECHLSVQDRFES